MRWAVIRDGGKVKACIPESMAVAVTVVHPNDPNRREIPALMPVPGILLPLAGKPGIALTWEDNPVELEGQPEFGKETSDIILAGSISAKLDGRGPLFNGGN